MNEINQTITTKKIGDLLQKLIDVATATENLIITKGSKSLPKIFKNML
jgi:hypothetical protein